MTTKLTEKTTPLDTTPTQANQHTPSIFFRLPPELRLVVYDELLLRSKNDRRWRISTQFLQTCKLIKAEAEPILHTKVHFRVRLSVSGGDTPSPHIHVKTLFDDEHDKEISHKRDLAYRSSAWYAALRKFRCVSIAIKLDEKSLAPNHHALNHALAGLLCYIDAASEITDLHLRVLGDPGCHAPDLEDILHPVCVWGRRMAGVRIRLIHLSPELRLKLLARIAYIPRTDDDQAVEQLFSGVRMAARAAIRLQRGNSIGDASSLDRGMAGILDEVGFIMPGCKVRAQKGISAVKKLLKQILEGLWGGFWSD